jgi:hypothetical protein
MRGVSVHPACLTPLTPLSPRSATRVSGRFGEKGESFLKRGWGKLCFAHPLSDSLPSPWASPARHDLTLYRGRVRVGVIRTAAGVRERVQPRLAKEAR